jgi:hypothetical protein
MLNVTSIVETPVIFIIFKRPHTTEKVFEAIRQARPTKLLLITTYKVALFR